MTNNQLCSFLGILGIVVACFSMGCMFFGMTIAWIPASIGAGISAISVVNFD